MQMRLASCIKTLASIVAGVLLFSRNAQPAGNVALTLARQLYAEGDWSYAQVEATRAYQYGNTNMPLSKAIKHLAGLHQNPTNEVHLDTMQTWINAHPEHELSDWMRTEMDAAQTLGASPRQRITGWFARGFIRFYQTQIGPALGQRCSMHPSCSHYSLEACRRYGLVGIPMTADRIIRESDHIRHRINPMIRDGRELYYNPVQDHSRWFRRYQK